MSRKVRVPLADFLKQRVEGYLFADLGTMRESGPTDVSRPGHVGYPMVQSCCSGIELLGSLIAPERDFYDGQADFVLYWNEFLYPNLHIGASFYQLVRNGLDHLFLTRPGVDVTKHQPEKHLTVWRGRLQIDSTQLARDLSRSYYERYRPNLDFERVQLRLDRLMDEWANETHLNQIRKELAKLCRRPAIATVSFVTENRSTISPSGSVDVFGHTAINSPAVDALYSAKEKQK